MTERNQKRRFDVTEDNNEMSHEITDILNDELPITYLILQMYNFFKKNPIPTDINIHDQFKNNPKTLMKNFHVYLKGTIDRFLGEYYFSMISGNTVDFTYAVENNKVNIMEHSDVSSVITIAPKIYLNYLPSPVPEQLSIDLYEKLIIDTNLILKFLKNIIDGFTKEMLSKYGDDIMITVFDSDSSPVIHIVFDLW